MRIAIIGAGFTGLAASLRLSKAGHKITLFEKDSLPGGLAVGFKDPKWEWGLEKHYHHWFTNDKNILSMAKEMKYEVLTQRPKTSVYFNNKIYQLDSPINLLRFTNLSIIERIRMGLALALLKFNPFWQLFEPYKASSLLPLLMGRKPYEKLWKPLLVKKFGDEAKNISLAWFWARIKKRTPSLAYPKGGFLEFANEIVTQIEKLKGEVLLNTQVKEIRSGNNGTTVQLMDNNTLPFDKIIVTLPSFFFIKIAPQLPKPYRKKLLALKGLSAMNLVLRLNKPFLKDGTYWLNICDEKYPITAIVEHTNFMDRKHYNNECLVYLGNYLNYDHPFMKMGKDKLLKIFDPILTRINKQYKSSILNTELFIAPFAQPIIPVNYSRIKPPFETPLKNVYLANIQQVYPWDRGTNYAVELGEKIADVILGK
ncbi:MAG: FAD-dependent oxidoreductase [Candidatus Parcubacteria bacterium]|nr:FAD-dependent oxidoreductase [Candidatus Parcubacteria bacterium]